MLRLFSLALLAVGGSANWQQLGYDIDGEAAGDESGRSVALSANGTIVAIGADFNYGSGGKSGHVRVYKYEADAWTQLGGDIDGEAAEDQSGYSVSLSNDGTIVAIGAPVVSAYTGHVRVYRYEANANAWVKLGDDIDGEAAYDVSGYSVSLSNDGTIVAIGALFNDGNGTDSGHVRVYRYEANANAWVKLGDDIDGEAAEDQSGHSVSLSADGTIVAIGAISASGHVRVYKYEADAWTQLGGDIDGDSGFSVSLSNDGTIVAIGAPYVSYSTGRVRVYRYDANANAWEKLGDDIDGEAAEDQSGHSVSLSNDGTIVAIGALLNDGNGTDSGQVRVYKYEENSTPAWQQLGGDIDGEAAWDKSGWSVSLSADGTIVAIGATINNGNGSNLGHVRVYGLASGVDGDPHMHFAGGKRADFRGVPGRYFSLVSAPGFALNVRIANATFAYANATIHGTYMVEAAVRCGPDVRMLHNATNATQWGFGWHAVSVHCRDRASAHYVHPHTRYKCPALAGDVAASASVEYATATLTCGAWTVHSTVQPVARHVGGAMRNLDLKILGPAAGAHGIVGQNLDARTARDGRLDVYPTRGEHTTSAQAEGALDGRYVDYVVASAHATDFRYTRFKAVPKISSVMSSASVAS